MRIIALLVYLEVNEDLKRNDIILLLLFLDFSSFCQAFCTPVTSCIFAFFFQLPIFFLLVFHSYYPSCSISLHKLKVKKSLSGLRKSPLLSFQVVSCCWKNRYPAWAGKEEELELKVLEWLFCHLPSFSCLLFLWKPRLHFGAERLCLTAGLAD